MYQEEFILKMWLLDLTGDIFKINLICTIMPFEPHLLYRSDIELHRKKIILPPHDILLPLLWVWHLGRYRPSASGLRIMHLAVNHINESVMPLKGLSHILCFQKLAYLINCKPSINILDPLFLDQPESEFYVEIIFILTQHFSLL